MSRALTLDDLRRLRERLNTCDVELRSLLDREIARGEESVRRFGDSLLVWRGFHDKYELGLTTEGGR